MTKSDFIKQCFDAIDQITIGQFVTLRGFDEIPDQVAVNNDIDIMVCGSHVIEPLNHHFSQMGFTLNVDNHTYLYGAEPHFQFINHQMDTKFDIVTGLYYRSMNDKMTWIPINKEVEKSMMINKVKVEEMWKKQPSVEDELVHILCHCIFDKRDMKEKYISRIHYLFDKSEKTKLKTLLEKAFYSFSEKIYDNMIENTRELSNLYLTYNTY